MNKHNKLPVSMDVIEMMLQGRLNDLEQGGDRLISEDEFLENLLHIIGD